VDSPAGTKLGLDVKTPIDIKDRSLIDVPDAKCFWFAIAFTDADSDTSTYESLSDLPPLHFGSEGSSGPTEGTPESTSSRAADKTGADNDVQVVTKCSSAFGEHGHPTALGDVKVGPLLGSGSFGKVYRGLLDDVPVAVKVIDYRGRNGSPTAQLWAEIKLQQGLDGPGIVRMLSSGMSCDESDEEKIGLIWMVQELCDKGDLTSATERGWLRVERKIDAPPSMAVIIPVMRDIAAGMEYLHSRNTIHSDLTGRNILLASADCPHGFTAKVGDFGIARVTQSGEPLCTNTLGTITHMPPELLLSNVLGLAADVWAFGVVAWEAIHGKQAYAGRNTAQITLTVVKNRPLQWPEDLPKDFVDLMKLCLNYDAGGRPPFGDVVTALDAQAAAVA